MKKIAENRYPHSATLFKFCKEALEIRYDGNVKVIDQDVGAILGYDPADCSHWKKGKKNIRALSTLRSIADHLNIDERLLIDIAGGKVGLEEAIFEYKGYGDFILDGHKLESLKKEYFKDPSKWHREPRTGDTFEELFDVNRPRVAEAAEAVLKLGNFEEAPIYIPEVFQLFNNLQLETDPSVAEVISAEYEGESTSLRARIKYVGPEMRPYVRFLAAKHIYKYLCHSESELVGLLSQAPGEVQDVQANIFAGLLLVPGHLIRKEVEKVDSSLDVVQQLADTFWVSKALMNQRLRDYMDYLN